jgi:hypothetical protein
LTAAQELLDRLAEIGAVVKPDGDNLILRAGPKPIPGELVSDLRRVKSEVLARLSSPDYAAKGIDGRAVGDVLDAPWWRRHFTIRTIHWGLSGKWTKDEAERLAYGELLDEWRMSRGRRWPAWQCAGCDEPIGDLSALLLADETRVHFGEERECLIRFGRRWQGEAAAALRALGLEPPLGFELP